MILELLIIIIAILTIVAVEKKDMVYAVIILGSADILLALVFFLLSAPDIAITQASIVAGLSTFIYILTIKKTERCEK